MIPLFWFRTVLAIGFPDKIVPDCNPVGPSNAVDTCGACKLAEMASNIFDFLVTSAFVIATIYLIVGGFRFIFSGGNPENITKARKNITAAIVGLIIVLVAWVGINTLMVTFTSLGGEWYKLGEHLGCTDSPDDTPPPDQTEVPDDSCASEIIMPAGGDLKILLPLYNYPNWYSPQAYIWDEVSSAGNEESIVAIVNPNNGPTATPNTDYVQGMNMLKQGGVGMVGYIYTSYGNRSLSAVKSDIDTWNTQYSSWVSGIFIDEVADNKYSYYKEIYDYIRAKQNVDTWVILNPGTSIASDYTSISDIVVVAETQSSNWSSFQPSAYVQNHSGNEFAALIHATPSEQMKDVIKKAVDKNIYWVFVTDDSLPNPWDTLPSYWQQEISCTSSV